MSKESAWEIETFGFWLDVGFGGFGVPDDDVWVDLQVLDNSLPKSLQQIALTCEFHAGPPLAWYLHHAGVGGQNSGNSDG